MRSSLISSFALTALLAAGCSGSSSVDKTPPGTGTDGTTGVTTMSSSDTAATTDGTTGGPADCTRLQCSGHGGCVDGDDGPTCVCDDGYVLDLEDATKCVVDETCINLRFLEDHCRQVLNGAPAVSLFFAVDFCAGTAVLPDKLQELGLGFKILESGTDIAENVESYATVIDKDVESYVTIVLDASDSITGSEDLGALITEVRSFVSSLKPAAGDPPVYVSVIAFGRRVQDYVEFTSNLDAVDAALADLGADPDAALVHPIKGAWNGMGTALFDAVKTGIHRTDGIRAFRDLVSDGGVLTTGTVVVITDGNDTVNADLDTGLIGNTLSQVISVGISDMVEDADLQKIGRDGSFLAPTPADWTTSFAEIAERVDQYPDRAYLLAYCSSASTGSPDVEVTLDGEVVAQTTAVCQFNADLFASNPPKCTADFFTSECANQACGGLTACGACGSGECCSSGSCAAPSNVANCHGVDELCAQTGDVCLGKGTVDEPYFCGAPTDSGQECSTTLPPCDPGVAWCDTELDPDTCVDTFAPGQVCEEGQECQTLHCSQTNTDNPLDPKICQDPARLFDKCSGNVATCPSGAYCAGDCQPKKSSGTTCGSNEECESGLCEGMGTKFCVPTGACYFSWDSKIG